MLGSAMRDRNLSAATFLITLGAPERYDQAVTMVFEVVYIEAHKLGSAKPASKTQ
jgi:hypothetical protein